MEALSAAGGLEAAIDKAASAEVVARAMSVALAVVLAAVVELVESSGVDMGPDTSSSQAIS